MTTHEKAYWYPALMTFNALVTDPGDRQIVLGFLIDEMQLPLDIVKERFAKMWAKSIDPAADFEDILATFAMELLVSRVGIDDCTQDLCDTTIAETVKRLTELAFLSPLKESDPHVY